MHIQVNICPIFDMQLNDSINSIKTYVRYVLIVVNLPPDGATHAIDHRDPSEYFISH